MIQIKKWHSSISIRGMKTLRVIGLILITRLLIRMRRLMGGVDTALQSIKEKSTVSEAVTCTTLSAKCVNASPR